MHSLQSQFRRTHIIFFSLLILFCITAAPDRPWAKAPAAAQCPTITLGPNLVQVGTVGRAYSLNLTASGGRAPYTYSRISGALPPGILMSSGGTIGGTPTEEGSFSFRIRATDADGCPGEKSYTISVVCPAISLTPNTLPGAGLGVAYSQTLSASGGESPYTFSRTAGALPPGLFLGSNGALGGTPNATGNYNFTIQATDRNGCAGSRAYSMLVVCPGITLGPGTLPAATVGASYSQSISASGGQTPYTYSITSGSTPPGMLLGSNGSFGGTPTARGTYTFTIRATDANGCTGSRAYGILVNCPDILVLPLTLASAGARVGVPYSQTFNASGGKAPYTFSLNTGSLPPGLTLGTNGTLSGTPTTTGSYSFSLTATDDNGCIGVRAYSLNVDPCPAITITPLGLPDGSTGVSYSQNLDATGGSGRYTFSIVANSLPPGLNLSSANGLISGMPTTPGTYSFQVRATDSNGCAGTRAYTMTISCGPITITPASLPSAPLGVSYSQNLDATGGRPFYSFSLLSGNVPPGMSVANYGGIVGTPTTAGSYTFTVRAIDVNNCFGDRTYTLNVTCPTITINPAGVPSGTVGTAYSQTFSATGGTAPYSFGTNASALPPGLTLNTNGSLSGTPTAAGSYSFIVRGNDANGCVGERSYTLVINPACPTITVNPVTLPAGTAGTAYTQTVSATGGTAPYAFSLSTGALPPGVSLALNGALTGTPTAGGSYSFTARATDANGCAGERGYTLVINNNPTCPTITFNPLSLPPLQVGLVFGMRITASGGTFPYAHRISTGALPPGVILQSDGNLTGNPTTAGSYGFTISATDANGCTGSRGYTLAVNNPTCPSITVNPASFPAGTIGAAYNQSFTATGGAAPYAFSILNGALPPGLSLSSSGALTGTPTTRGNYVFQAGATDANGCTGTRSYTLVINNPACPSITVNPAALPAGTTGVVYNQTLTATGGAAAYSFSITTGTLPSGLSLSASGNLSGTPTTTGSYSFTARATDANGCTGERGYTIVINNPACPTITVNPASLPGGTTGAAYSQTLTATGGAAAYGFSITTGTLPTGLSLASNGSLTGTPTAAGSYSFTARATDANGCTGERGYTIVISNPACPTITVNPASLPGGTTGAAYNQTFTATGGAGSVAFSITTGTLPTGLSLASNGSLTGTPTTAGNYSFTARATDANGCTGERGYTLVISNPVCPTITINPASLPAGRTRSAYSQTITATGGAASYAFSISTGTLPTGLSLASNGSLTGTPTAAGTYNFSVRATDATNANGCAGERPYTIVVSNPDCAAITLDPATLPAGVSGTAYNQTVTATGGTAAYTFSVSSGALPAGLSLAASGALTGTPATAGNVSFTVRATDANGCVGERSYTIAVANNLVTSVSAASYAPSGPLAPESIVAAFGSNMATSTQIATTLPLPTTLAGVSLKVRDSAGVERLAPLFFVSRTQINYQVPPNTGVGPAGVTVENGAGNLAPSAIVATGTIEVANVSPGLFSADASGRGVAAANVLRVKADGTQSYEAIARFDAALNRFVAVPIDLGPATDQVFLVFYGTGFKFRSALSAVSCAIGGVNGEVLYAGEVAGLAGLDQLNARLSRSLAGRGEVDVIVVADGRTANTVRVAIR
jgi:uncharacterized protein (TIGR03437 family)